MKNLRESWMAFYKIVCEYMSTLIYFALLNKTWWLVPPCRQPPLLGLHLYCRSKTFASLIRTQFYPLRVSALPACPFHAGLLTSILHVAHYKLYVLCALFIALSQCDIWFFDVRLLIFQKSGEGGRPWLTPQNPSIYVV